MKESEGCACLWNHKPAKERQFKDNEAWTCPDCSSVWYYVAKFGEDAPQKLRGKPGWSSYSKPVLEIDGQVVPPHE